MQPSIENPRTSIVHKYKKYGKDPNYTRDYLILLSQVFLYLSIKQI